jgi:hypothetical protein
MSTEAANTRKRKPTEDPVEVVSSSVQSKNEARRVSADASASTNARLVILAEASSESKQGGSASNAQQDESMVSIGTLVQDLLHSDNAKVYAALDALDLALDNDKKKCENIHAVGGCFALVQLMQDCLKKASEKLPACGRVTKLYPLAELMTLRKTLHIIICLTHHLDECKVGITAIGGVEAVVKAMRTFPQCLTLQEFACNVILNLACCSIFKKQAAERDAIEVLLAAINNHFGSAYICERACLLLISLIADSSENIELFICLGGASAVAKVKKKWPGNDRIQDRMRHLSKSIASHFMRWAKAGK